MSSDKFRRDLQRRAAAKAKQTQSAQPVKVKEAPKKVPVWQGCMAIGLVMLLVGGMLFAVLYKTKVDPIMDNVMATTTAIMATSSANAFIFDLKAACVGYTNLTVTRCGEKAQAAWNEDAPTVRVCVGAFEDDKKTLLECVVDRGLWD